MRAGSTASAMVLRQQQQHVDVGIREELAAAEAADRDQRELVAEARVGPESAQRFVGQRRELAQHGVDTARGRARAAQLVEQRQLVRAVGVAQRRNVHHDRLERPGRRQAAALTKAGGGGLPAESVSTS